MKLLDNIKPLTMYTCVQAFWYSISCIIRYTLAVLLGLAVTAGLVEIAWLLFSGKHYPFDLFVFSPKDWLFLGKAALYTVIFFGVIFFLAYFNDPPPLTQAERQAEDDWYFWNVLMYDDHDDHDNDCDD